METPSPLLPKSEEEQRVGFYFCNALIQQMESIYREAHLEDEHDRPNNRGWMNLFRLFAGSGMFRVTWSMTVSTRSPRFQQFCRRHLGLELGTVVIGRWLRATVLSDQCPDPDCPFPNRVEWMQLKTLRESLKDSLCPATLWSELYIVPLRLRIRDSAAESESFFLDIGFALIRPDPRTGLQLYYYRVRDHLRRMGLGRQGLEALWREDCRLTPEPVPQQVSHLIAEANRDGLMRLWHSVLAAVPHQEIKRGELLLDVYEGIQEVARSAGRRHGLREGYGSLITLLPDPADRLGPGDALQLDDLNRLLEKWKADAAGANYPDHSEQERDMMLVAELERLTKVRKLTPRHQPTDTDSLLAVAEELLPMATSAYQDAIAKQPDNEEAWRGIARVLAARAGIASRQHKVAAEIDPLWSGAIRILGKLIADNGYASLAYYNRACCRILRHESIKPKDEREIIKDLQTAFAIRPDLKDSARTDSDLQWLSNRPEFIRLLEPDPWSSAVP